MNCHWNNIDESKFYKSEWNYIFGNFEEEVPTNIPPERETLVKTLIVDYDYQYGNLLNVCSHTIIFFFINSSIINWYSKGKVAVESVTFRSEYVSLRNSVEKLKEFMCRIYMMGILIDGPCDVLCDNMTVVTTYHKTDTRPTKKQNEINFHHIREELAASCIRVDAEKVPKNMLYLLTKFISITNRRPFMNCLTYLSEILVPRT